MKLYEEQADGSLKPVEMPNYIIKRLSIYQFQHKRD